MRFIDPTGEKLQTSGDQVADYIYLCNIAGDACLTAANRLSVDPNTGLVSFNAEGLDLSQNEGANLINDLVKSDHTYDLSSGTIVDTAGGMVDVDYIKNLPPTADQVQYRKCQCSAPTETPKRGVDDQVAFNEYDTRGQHQSLTDLKLAAPFTVVFHELAEAYAKWTAA
jgi:hypothetical protein